MKRTSKEYIEFLKRTKNISKNTEMSYIQDLDKMIEYFYMHHIFDYERITVTNINSYIMYLELKGMSSATIARNVAVIKGYFDYLFRQHKIPEYITDQIQKPTLKKNVTVKASREEAEKILEIAKGDKPKNKRDYLMFRLMCEVGLQVTELVELKVQEVNLEVGFIICTSSKIAKTYSLSSEVSELIRTYIEEVRPSFVVDEGCNFMFMNVKGESMSRQGFWKVIKTYAIQAGVEDISPTKLCKSLI